MVVRKGRLPAGRLAHARVDGVAGVGERAGGERDKPARCPGDQDDVLHDRSSGGHHAKPPLARSTCALTQPPSGPARNETIGTTSSGRPRRSSGASFLNCSICASVLPFRKRSVATGPGATALTVIWRPRSSLASTRTSPSTPAFEAMKAPYPGNDLAMTLLENAMIRPPLKTC